MSNYNVAWKECPTCTEGQISPKSGLSICCNCAGHISVESLDLMRRTGLVPTEMLKYVNGTTDANRETTEADNAAYSGTAPASDGVLSEWEPQAKQVM
jgi:hypothetical protein